VAEPPHIGGVQPPHIFLIIIFIFNIYFFKNNNILLFYIKWDTWLIYGCWIRMDGEGLKKNPWAILLLLPGIQIPSMVTPYQSIAIFAHNFRVFLINWFQLFKVFPYNKLINVWFWF
jgi:hypothetical protein